MREITFCAQACRDEQEPFIGSAAHADAWLLIEYTGAWQRSAVKDSALPESVKQWLAAQSDAFPRLRTQLIKQHTRPVTNPLCFLALVREGEATLYRFELNRYEDLLTLDLGAIARDEQAYQANRYDKPLYLVCTHGKHDQCCAKFGMPIYNEFVSLVGDQAWQTSHVGGDKFAANVVCFPRGVYYGQVTRSDVALIVERYQHHEVHLERFRGQSCYKPIEQAAEYFLREQTQNYDLRAFRLLEAGQVQDDSSLFSAIFQEAGNGRLHTITFACEKRELTSYSACKGLWKHTVPYYYLRQHSVADSPALAVVS